MMIKWSQGVWEPPPQREYSRVFGCLSWLETGNRGIWAVMMHCLPPGIDNMSVLGIAYFPPLESTLSPYHQWDIVGNSYHGKWKMTRWTRSVLTCVCREAIGDVILEQPGLIWQLRRELKVCNCTGMIVGMVGVRPSVILVGRAGHAARLFIAEWAWPRFSHNTQPTNMSKFVNTLTPIYIRAWPVYTKLH